MAVRPDRSPVSLHRRSAALSRYWWPIPTGIRSAGTAQRTFLALDKTLAHGAVLVDDKPVITGARTPDWVQVVFDQPYNQATPGPRLHSWEAWEDVVLPVAEASLALR